MKLTHIFRLLFGLIVLAANSCAAYQAPELALSHPAHPRGAPAPVTQRSLTLAYGAADVAALRARPVTLAQADGPAPSAEDMISADGSVVAVVPSASQLVVQHGEIKGFMDAMTMGYRVEPSSLLDGLKFGDKVRFTIDVPKKAIIKIEKMK